MALARLAPEFGIPESKPLAMMTSDDYTDRVRADEARAASFGIGGVPFFVNDEKVGISGVEALAQALADSK